MLSKLLSQCFLSDSEAYPPLYFYLETWFLSLETSVVCMETSNFHLETLIVFSLETSSASLQPFPPQQSFLPPLEQFSLLPPEPF